MKQKNTTIIIGEDDHAIIEVIKIILQDAGYNPIGVTEARNIMKSVETHSPALIFLDIWMSGEDGGVIAKKLKQDPKTKHIPIIMLSANNETGHIAELVGAQDFLQKPFDMDELIAIVKKHI